MKRYLIIFSVIISLLLVSATVFIYKERSQIEDGKIAPGIKIDGIDIGRLTEGQAFEKLKTREKSLLSGSIRVVYGGENWNIPYSAIANTNLQALIKKAAHYGRGKGLITDLLEIYKAKNGKYNFQIKLLADNEKVSKYVYNIKTDLDRLPIEPKINVSDDNRVTVEPPKEGVGVDTQATNDALISMLKSGSSGTVNVHVYSLKPKFSEEAIKKWRFDGYISTFTTNFNPLNKERTENVRIAARALDKTVIYPGEEFSFNKVVGPRSKEAGYKEALVIQDNLFIPGVGGGVCQVATTLYNNILKSNLQVLERRRHSLPVPYVSPGLDATVAYGLVDLRFKNIYDFPVIIRTNMLANKLFIGILGDKSKVPQINITTQIEGILTPTGSRTVYDPLLPKGKTVVEQAKKGYIVSVYKQIVESAGKKTILVSKDKYPPTPQIIKIGTKQPNVLGEVYEKAF